MLLYNTWSIFQVATWLAHGLSLFSNNIRSPKVPLEAKSAEQCSTKSKVSHVVPLINIMQLLGWCVRPSSTATCSVFVVFFIIVTSTID